MEVKTYSKIRYLDQDFVYCIVEGQLLIEGKTFFTNILGKLGYSKFEGLKKQEECSLEVMVSEKRSYYFYPIGIVEKHLLKYEVPVSKFKASPEKYSKYIEFMQLGLEELALGLANQEDLVIEYDWAKIDISHLVEIEQKQEQESNEIESMACELEDLKLKIKQQQDRRIETTEIYEKKIGELKSEVVELTHSKNDLLDDKIVLQDKLEGLNKSLSQKDKEQNEDKLGSFLQRNSVKTWLTIFVICTFLPFTVGALVRYIPFVPVNSFQTWMFGILCFLMALVWDSSILYFAKTGMQRMSRVGSIYQFLFFCAEFDLIAVFCSDMIGLEGLYWQKIIITFCIVSFSAVLVNQFTELSTKKDHGE